MSGRLPLVALWIATGYGIAAGLSWEHSKEHLWRAYERALHTAGDPDVSAAAR